MVDLKKSCYLCCFLFAVVDNAIGSGIELDFRDLILHLLLLSQN